MNGAKQEEAQEREGRGQRAAVRAVQSERNPHREREREKRGLSSKQVEADKSTQVG